LQTGQPGVYINPRYESRSRLISDPHHKILIDYGGDDHPRDAVQVVDLDHDAEISITGQNPALYLRHASYDGPPVPSVMHANDRGYRAYYGDTMSSDTSSAYSGSDTMHSLQSGQEELDLSGLHESHVDSDEEDLAESIGSFTLRDAVRDCLEKDPSDRTEEDIEILMEFTHTLEAFAGMTQAVRTKMCSVMVFAVVDKADTIVMNDHEELDSWSVIINGAVRVEGGEGGRNYVLSLGQGFGIKPTMKKEYHHGIMTTMVDDCQFVCITQGDYYKILHEGEDALVKEEEDGELVKVSEVRRADDGIKHVQVLLRARPDKLINQLIEDTNSADTNYIEDFLLCHRVFLESSLVVVQQLLEWFDRQDLRDKVTRILLLWVNNHFTDFELDSEMMELLNMFEHKLEGAKMQGQLRMLNFACAAKARARTAIVTRPSRDEPLEFRLAGGHQRGFGIFIESVNKASSAAKKGIKRGDQILEVNGENFLNGMSLERAMSILQSQCHLQLQVKSNYLGFKEVQCSENTRRPPKKPYDINSRSNTSPNLGLTQQNKDDLESKMATVNISGSGKRKTTKYMLMDKFKQLLNQPKLLSTQKLLTEDADFEAAISDYEEIYDFQDAIPEHSLKIYKADQSSKYLLVNKTTSAKEVVMLALKEFGITEVSTNYALFEVTVENGLIRQRRLAERFDNLAQRIGLASRYYIKNTQSNQQLVPEEMSSELQRESVVNILSLNCQETATQLMVEDFTLFRQIEQTEFVDWIFELNSKFGTDNLTKFSELVNKETLWVVSEVVGETNLGKRVKLVKLFLKIAKQCKENQNYNSMFAITAGLTHNAVSRLKHTWERIPEKYNKLLTDLQGIMDPSRNFSRYRNLIKSDTVKPPLIPIFPMVSKDLSFMHIGNKTKMAGLVNFEKMRLVAKEIRNLTNMCSAPLRGISDTIIAMNDTEQPGKYATMKRGKGKRDAPDARKMYNEALMIRKVKSYLLNINITTDEEILQRMSIEIEPPQVKASLHVGSTSSLKSGQRPPSPTPSRSSATSTFSEGKKSLASAPGKFGASSPEAERKLLSLAENKLGKTKRMPKMSKSTYSLSPGPSPVQLRREAAASHAAAVAATAHSRSNSDTPAVPVSLSAESSSVSSLPGLRRGSVSSQDEEFRPRSGETVHPGIPRHKSMDSRQLELVRKASSASCGGSVGGPLDVPPRAGGSLPPPRPPDYQTTMGRNLKTGLRPRLSRTQSRDSGGPEAEDETQVSAV